MKRTLLGAIAAAATVLFADLAGLNLAWSNWFDAGIASLTEGGTLTSEWTTPSAAGDVTIGNARIDIDTDDELVYTPTSPSSSQIVRCDVSVYPTLHGGFPDEAPADDVQTMLVPYTNNGVVAWAACVKVSGETNWVSLTGVTPTPNALTDVRIEFDYRSTPQVSFSVKSGGEYVVLQDANENTWFATLNAKTEVSSIAFTGEGAIASLAGANGYVVDPGSIALYGGTGYSTFEAAIAAAAADGYSAGPVTLLADVSWTPAATGDYQIDVNGNTLTINGASGSWSGTTYTVTALNYYYWIGGDSTEWANGGNWSHTLGGAAANAYPNDWRDVANFPSGASIAVDGTIYVGTIFTDGALTLSGGGNIQTSSANNNGTITVGGTGLFRLAGITLVAPYGTSLDNSMSDITNAVEIVAGTTNVLKLAVGANVNRAASFNLRGALQGSGTLFVTSNTTNERYQVSFYGNAASFSGTLYDHLDADEYATRVQFMSADALSASACYNLSSLTAYNRDGYNYVLRAGGPGATYRMGALNGNVRFDGNDNTISTRYYGYTLEIGGRNENCSFGGTLARSANYASTTKKVGTADMTFTGSQMADIIIENGTYVIGAATAVPSYGYIKFAGGALSVAKGVTVDPVARFSTDGSTAAVVFDDRGRNNTWAGELTAARVPCGFTKKGAGVLTLTTAPTYTSATTIEAGTLIVPKGTTIASLACEGGKLTVPISGSESEENVLTITSLAEGTTVEELEEALNVGGATMSVASGEGGYVVKATRTSQEFTWTGANGTNLADPANWSVGGGTAITAPFAMDTVVFPAEGAPWEATLSANATFAGVTFNGKTVLAGGREFSLASDSFAGTAQIVLSNACLYATATNTLANAIEIAEATTDILQAKHGGAAIITLNGPLSGSGDLICQPSGTSNGGGVHFNAANPDFTGTITLAANGNQRATHEMHTPDAVNCNMRVIVDYMTGNNNHKVFPFYVANTNWVFGALNGTISNYRDNNPSDSSAITLRNLRLTIGGRNEDCSLAGAWASGVAASRWFAIIDWAAPTATMEYGVAQTKAIEISGGGVLKLTSAGAITSDTGLSFLGNGGTLKVSDPAIDPSASIKDSTVAIAFDTDGSDCEWATALAASNVGGLTKKGAGKLTLSALPLYTGLTTVEEGSLVVPPGTEITLNALHTDNVPENATVVGYGYPVGTTLTGAESVRTFDKPLDVANVDAIDLSDAPLVPRQAFVIATATEIQNFNAKDIVLTLPEGADPTLWRLAAANGELRLSPRRVGGAIRLQ